MLLFRPLAASEVRRAYEASAVSVLGGEDLNSVRSAISTAAEGPRKAYAGGIEAVRFLVRNPRELPEKFKLREHLFHNVRVVKPYVDLFSSLVYGEAPGRSYWLNEAPPDPSSVARELYEAKQARGAEATDQERGQEADTDSSDVDDDDLAYDAWCKKQLSNNRHRRLFREGYKARILTGLAPLKMWLRRDANAEITGLRIDFFAREDAIPILDPDDPKTCVAVAEARADGDEIRWILWTADRWDWVDPESLRVLAPGMEHELGRPPFAFLGDGHGLCADAVLDQAHAINLYSSYDIIKRSQGFAVPVIEGLIKNLFETTESGERRVKVSESDFLHLETGGSFAFAMPNAPLDHHLEGIRAFLAGVFKSHSLPDDLIKESTGVEAPMAMLFRWLATMVERDWMVAEATAFEHDLGDLFAAYGEVYGSEFALPEFSREWASSSAVFAENPLPQNDTERERVLRERWEAGALHIVEYVMATHPDMSPEEVVDYAISLEKSQKQKLNPLPTGIGFDLGVTL